MSEEITPFDLSGSIMLINGWDDNLRYSRAKSGTENQVSRIDLQRYEDPSNKAMPVSVEEVDRAIKILQDAKRFLEGKRSKWVRF